MSDSNHKAVIDELTSAKQETSRKFFKPASFSALIFQNNPPMGSENVFTFKVTPKGGVTSKDGVDNLITIANEYIKNNNMENVSIQHRKVRENAGFIIKITASSQEEAKNKIIQIMDQAILPNVDSIKGGKELEKQERQTAALGM